MLADQIFPVFFFLLSLPYASFVVHAIEKTHYRSPPEVVPINETYNSPLDEVFDYYSSEDDSSEVGGRRPLSSVLGQVGGDSFPKSPFLLQSLLAGNGSECQQKCMKIFSLAFRLAVKSPNNFERFHGVCDKYNETVECMDALEKPCENQEVFNIMTSGLYYMCIEQRGAFEAVIECIDAQTVEVEKECELVCHAKERMAHWTVQSGLLDNFVSSALGGLTNGESMVMQLFGPQHSPLGGKASGIAAAAAASNSPPQAGGIAGSAAAGPQGPFAAAGEKVLSETKKKWVSGRAGRVGRLQAAPPVGAQAMGPKARFGIFDGVGGIGGEPQWQRITPELLKGVVQDGCDLTRCQLTCFRLKFDAKCGGNAGTLISEAFVRPISESQRLMGFGTMSQIIGAFMPVTCDFMFRSSVLQEFRIPPDTDRSLHEKYDNKPLPSTLAGGDDLLTTDTGDDDVAIGEEDDAEKLLAADGTVSKSPLDSEDTSPLDSEDPTPSGGEDGSDKGNSVMEQKTDGKKKKTEKEKEKNVKRVPPSGVPVAEPRTSSSSSTESEEKEE